MTDINPIGPNWKGKKYVTRSGKIITLERRGEFLFSPETGYYYDDRVVGGNLVYNGEWNPDDIVAEYTYKESI
jgi:phage gpG-like protein